MKPEEFQMEVLQRLTKVETELKMMRRNGWGSLTTSGGLGGGVAVGILIAARALGLV